eukprot:353025-Chlamydomonas_euryale.AAC.4
MVVWNAARPWQRLPSGCRGEGGVDKCHVGGQVVKCQASGQVPARWTSVRQVDTCRTDASVRHVQSPVLGVGRLTFD